MSESWSMHNLTHFVHGKIDVRLGESAILQSTNNAMIQNGLLNGVLS